MQSVGRLGCQYLQAMGQKSFLRAQGSGRYVHNEVISATSWRVVEAVCTWWCSITVVDAA